MVEKEIEFDITYYEAYKKVNQIFAEKILSIYEDGDIVWIHDYHIMLTPVMLREQKKDMAIGFFLHIPFPSSEIFRSLPVREEILLGVLGSNMIAFHTYDYARHFRTSCSRLLGLETSELGILYQGVMRHIKTLPIGIDPPKFQEQVLSLQCQQKIKEIKNMYNNKKIILGIDRVDYSKGLPQKFAAFEKFLVNNEELAKDVVLIQVGVPSRTDVKEYKKLIKEINHQVGKIQALHGFVDSHGPLVYINKPVDFCTLCALYASADVCIVSSIRDGMNLVSLEYIACQEESTSNGVLIISEFAGASHSLCGSLIVNPFDINDTADAIQKALIMSEKEKLDRHRLNYDIISKNTAITWGRDFLKQLKECLSDSKELQRENAHLDSSSFISFYKKAQINKGIRIFFFDYDGTLVKMKDTANRVKPTSKVMYSLKILSEYPSNYVYIFSGRTREEMEIEFKDISSLGLVSEEGVSIKHPNSTQWEPLYETHDDFEWMNEVKSICKWFQSRTPNSYVEENAVSCLFHFKNTDPIFCKFQVLELQQHLEESFKAKSLVIFQGKNYLELRPKEICKGRFAKSILDKIIHKHNIQNESLMIDNGKNTLNDLKENERINNFASESIDTSKEKNHHLIDVNSKMNYYVVSIGDGNSDEIMFQSIDDFAQKANIEGYDLENEIGKDIEIETMNIAIRDYSNMNDATHANYVLHQSELSTILSSVLPLGVTYSKINNVDSKYSNSPKFLESNFNHSLKSQKEDTEKLQENGKEISSEKKIEKTTSSSQRAAKQILSQTS